MTTVRADAGLASVELIRDRWSRPHVVVLGRIRPPMPLSHRAHRQHGCRAVLKADVGEWLADG